MPVPGDWVEVDLGDGTGEHRTLIESAMATRLVVVPPAYTRYLHAPRRNAPVTASWTGERGRTVATATFVGVEADVTPARWTVVLTGRAQAEQRRRFTRAVVDGPVRVRVERDGRVVPGTRTVDVGEGGVRIRSADASTVQVDDDVHLRLGIGDRVLAVPGRVVRILRSGDGGWDTVIAFTAAEEPARQIRRFVLRRQIQDRAERLDRARRESVPGRFGRV